MCFHKFFKLERPKEGIKTKVQCEKCNGVYLKNVDKIPDFMMSNNRTNYLWCNCGNDLIRDSYEKELENGVYQYRCSSCGEKSIFNFIVAPILINIEELKRN